ncbi:MAG: NAD-binding protein [Nitriliruptorales bacterium]|nr:NAD-binding protein [Nitriliruptorales bacterium]
MHIRVGVIGLGHMGSAFAGNLLRSGFPVTGHDIAPAKVAALVAAGGVAGGSAAGAAGRADVVITSLPSVAALGAVVTELEGMEGDPGVLLEMGTLPIAAKEQAADRLAGRFTVLDCPVSGTGTQARTGDVVVYASGDRDAFTACTEALAGFSRAQYYVGPFGTGMRVKLIANLLVTVHNVAAAEAIVLARRAGIDLDLLVRVVGDGAGTSRMFEVRGPMMVAGSYDDSTANVEIYKKDLALITEFASGLDCPVPLLSASAQLYAAAMAQGRAHQDGAAVAAVLEGMAGGGQAERDGDGA